MDVYHRSEKIDDRKNIPLKAAAQLKALQTVANIVEYTAHHSGKRHSISV